MMIKKYLLITVLLLVVNTKVLAQIDLINPTLSCEPLPGICLADDCFPGGGGIDIPCTGFFCPPGDDGECDSTVQSCVNPDDGGEGECEGSDCGDNSCSATGNVAANSSGAQSTSTSNPINLISGNKYKRQEDIAPMSGLLGLEFVRHYNSSIPRNLGIGAGWRHSYSVGLSVREGFKPGEMEVVKIQQSDGRIVHFDRVGQRKVGAQYTTRNNADGFITTTEIGYKWHWRNGRIFSFDDRGLLTEISQDKNILSLQYSAGGQLLSIEDPQGRRLTLSYKDTLLTKVTEPSGNETLYKYAQGGQLLYVERPSGKTRFYHYEDKDRAASLTGITDERGIRVESYRYDDQGRAIVSTKGKDIDKVEIKYEPNQRVVTNALGESTTYLLEKINGQQVVKEVIGPGCSACSGSDVVYEYNDALQVVKAIQKNGVVVEYEYDKRERLVKEYRSSFEGNRILVKEIEYQGSSPRPSVIKKPSIKPGEFVTTKMVYTPSGKLQSGSAVAYAQRSDGQFDVINRTVSFAYDSLDRLVTVDGPRLDVDDITSIKWNNRNLMSQISTPDGTVQKFLEYDSNGQVTKLQVNDLTPMIIAYTQTGKVKSVRPYNGTEEHNNQVAFLYEYDDNDNLIRTSGPQNVSINYLYDDWSRVVRRDDGIKVIDYKWSKESLLLSKKTTYIRTQSYVLENYAYDTKDRITEITDHNGNVLQSRSYGDSFTKIDFDSKEQDLDNSIRYQSDDFGDLEEIVRQNTTTQFSTINGVSRITSFTDSENGQTIYGYDDFGSVSYINSPDSGLTKFYRDPSGLIISKTDAQGQTAEFQYDVRGQFKTVSYPNEVINTIEQPGETLQIQSSNTAESYQLKDKTVRELSRALTSVGQDNQRYDYVSQYNYDDLGRLESKILPGGQKLKYAYHENGNNEGLLKSVIIDRLLFDDVIIDNIEINNTLPEGASISDGLHHEDIVYTHGNGTKTHFKRDYDFQGKSLLRKLKHSGENLGDHEYSYLYNSKLQIIGVDENDRPYHRYRYNEKQELDFAMVPHSLYAYAYDDNNNRTTTMIGSARIDQEYAPDSNRITKMVAGKTELPIEYRDDGSIDVLGKLRFEYNVNGQPEAVYNTDSKKLIAKYAYNSRAERISKTTFINNEPQHTYYIYENKKLVAETNAQGEVIKQYLYAGIRPIAMIVEDDVFAIHSNHLGAPLMVSNKDGVAVWKAAYAPFGQAIVNSDPDGDKERFELNLRLPGQYEDKETRLHYNYYRYYEPITGRYISSDPLGLNAGPNTYAYVKNDPVHYSDPLGLLLFAFDGTGNEAQVGDAGVSNVALLAEAYTGDAGELQNQFGTNVFYITGVATFDPLSGYQRPTTVDNVLGASIPDRLDIVTGYFLDYLELLQDAGRSNETLNLDITGFSRGAATARVFANVIEDLKAGNQNTLDNIDRTFNPFVDRSENGADFAGRISSINDFLANCNIDLNLRFIGLFDTVPHFGLSQDNDLSDLPLAIPSSADHVVHAVAANENRADFQGVSIHNNASDGNTYFDANSSDNSNVRVELGFLGAHADIGGGYEEGDLSDVALNFVAEQAALAGVNINLGADQRVVTNPIVHDSLDVFPFVNADRDFVYTDGSQVDQAGNTDPGDSLSDDIFGQDTFSDNNAYGLNAEDTVGLFDNSLLETFLVCEDVFCEEQERKAVDNEGSRTLVGQVSDNVSIDYNGDGIDDGNYQQILSQPPYNLNIVISSPNPNLQAPITNNGENGEEYISDEDVLIEPTGTNGIQRPSGPCSSRISPVFEGSTGCDEPPIQIPGGF